MAVGYKYALFVLSFFFLCSFVFAQAASFFYRQGNNISQLHCGGVLFAPLTNKFHQAFGAGSVLVQKPIDLRKDFSVSFVLDFTDTTGVDGGAFIFQSDPAQVGETFNGLGVKGIKNSVAVTFDARQNVHFGDPAFDHAAIQTNGVIDHNTINNLAGPVSIEHLYRKTVYPPDFDLEKIFQHVVTVTWKASLKELSALVDGVLLVQARADLVANVFNGSPIVYWGFAASNTQETWYPAQKELQFGYMRFSFGDIFPRIRSLPETDTCFGPPVQVFDASIYGELHGLSGLTGAQWFWDFGDGTTTTVRNPPAHHYANEGQYNIRLAVTNAFGCTFDTVVQRVALGATPVADFSYTTACANSPVLFTDQSRIADGGIFHWEWKLGSAGTSNEQNPVVQFTDTGSRAIYLNVRSNLGCESDTVKMVRVDEKPLLAASHEEDCFGSVQYRGVLQNGVRIKTWQWAFGDGQSSAQQNPLHRFPANGVYQTRLSAVSEGGCVSDTVVQAVVVDVVNAFAGNDTIAVKGEPLQLSGRGNGSFRWSPATGLNDRLAASPIATLFADQAYVLTVTNAQGCEDRDTIRIKVFDAADIFVPTAFTPNGDGKNDVLHLVAPGFRQLLYFRIHDRWGQLVFETKQLKSGWDGRAHNQALPAGVYVWIAAGIDSNNRRHEKKGTVVLIR